MKSANTYQVNDQSSPQTGIIYSGSLAPTDVMVRLYEESRRTSADLQSEPRKVPEHLISQTTWREADCVPLPAPVALSQGRPLYEAMLERTSIRSYHQAPIDQSRLATILKAASDGDSRDWLGEEGAGISLQLSVIAWRITGIPPAIYRYLPAKHALAYVAEAPNQHEEGINLVLQVEFAQAPLIILITGNLAAASARYGGWGHRQLLLRAGAAGQRMWFASIGVGLVGVTFAGFLPRAARCVAGVDGYTNASLFAFSAGLPSCYEGEL